MRLDIELVSRKIAKSRSYAKQLIDSENVVVNDKIIIKCSHIVGENDVITIKNELNKYVSRGGEKLEKAINCFSIDVTDKICMDIGASTGGFTDCLLKNNAKLVYAVDVGSSQLDESIINNNKVINLENINIKDVNCDDFKRINFICCDLSFISVTKVVDKISSLLCDTGEAVILIKPQFEMDCKSKVKNGIVKSVESHKKVLYNVMNYVNNSNLYIAGLTFSPIKGRKGNIEFLAYCKRGNEKVDIFPDLIIENAHKSLK